MTFIIHCIEQVYYFLWGDWIRLPLPGGTLSLPLLVLLLIPAGIYFTVRTRGLQLRLLPDMVRLITGSAKPEDSEQDRKSEELSALQALIVSTATRVGMGNLVGVVAAISAGGAGAVFWMWITALIGSATSFVESTLAQLHKQEDPLYGGYRGGPAYYIHDWINAGRKGKARKSLLAILFAISGLICWCGVSQVIGNYVFSVGVREVKQSVERGRTISESMEEIEYFPKMLTEMVGVGERSGSLEQTLDVIGAYFDNEVEVLTSRLLSLMEPVITILLAVVVVFLLLAVYLPMFSMYGGIA